jgi:hypothetical protein
MSIKVLSEKHSQVEKIVGDSVRRTQSVQDRRKIHHSGYNKDLHRVKKLRLSVVGSVSEIASVRAFKL